MSDNYIGDCNAEFFARHLGERGFESLPMVLNADMQYQLSIRCQSSKCGFVTKDDG